MKAAIEECPKAVGMLSGLPRSSIMIWLMEYQSGREGLRALEHALKNVKEVPHAGRS